MPIRSVFDKRRVAARILLASLKSHNPKLRDAAIYKAALGKITQPYIHTVGHLALDKKQPESIRIWSIQLLGGTRDRRAFRYLRHIAGDSEDNICRRGDALEQMINFINDRSIHEYTRFLSDESSDMRFWAAFCLGSQQVDPTPALAKLDWLIAYDHTLPECFGWHIDREALLAYERIYFQQIFGMSRQEDGYYEHIPSPQLISSAPEYSTFSREYRTYLSSGVYESKSVPSVTLNVDGDWLIEQLVVQWPNIELNIRKPRPSGYKCDFKIVRGEERIIGGLHRDGYALILTGDFDFTKDFATWYRSVIDPVHPLYIYEWADQGKLLKL